MSLKSKLQNFFYYYKYHVFFGVAAVFIVIFLIISSATSANPDIQIFMTTKHSLLPAESNLLIEDFKKIVPDFNGDGEVKLNLSQIFLNPELENKQYLASMQMKFTTEIASGKSTLFICDKDSVKTYLTQDFLADIGDLDESLSVYDGRLIKIEDSTKIFDNEYQTVPKELYFGIRIEPTNKNDKKFIKEIENAKEVLKVIIEKAK